MGERKYYNLMIVPDGVEAPFGIRMQAWLFKTMIVAFSLLLVALILFFVFYGKIIQRAALADRLEKENEELNRYRLKVDILEQRMNSARDMVKRISELAGVEYEIPELPHDSIIFGEAGGDLQGIMTRSSSASPSRPNGLPLQGYMTRGYSETEKAEHYGIDIAATEGTPVLATASGTVSFAGPDSTFGNMVIIDHEDNVQTVYGHNSELLVELGKDVLVGGRIALSGNTGISTAPHLHYEIREKEIPVNPLKYMSEYDEKSN